MISVIVILVIFVVDNVLCMPNGKNEYVDKFGNQIFESALVGSHPRTSSTIRSTNKGGEKWTFAELILFYIGVAAFGLNIMYFVHRYICTSKPRHRDRNLHLSPNTFWQQQYERSANIFHAPSPSAPALSSVYTIPRPQVPSGDTTSISRDSASNGPVAAVDMYALPPSYAEVDQGLPSYAEAQATPCNLYYTLV